MIGFEWDPRKAATNLRKHRVSFVEATAGADPLASVYEDPDHSIAERRFLTIGTSAKGRLIHVAFADRGGRIRIINARPATRSERALYEKEKR
jgi:uncharacterized DUF497 family protein